MGNGTKAVLNGVDRLVDENLADVEVVKSYPVTEVMSRIVDDRFLHRWLLSDRSIFVVHNLSFVFLLNLRGCETTLSSASVTNGRASAECSSLLFRFFLGKLKMLILPELC